MARSLTDRASTMTARLLHGVARVRNGITLGVRAAIFDGDGRVFLVRHAYVAGWHFPGGGVEPHETAAEAVAREVREEGGITLDEPGELFGLYLNRTLWGRDHVALFLAGAWRQEGRPRLPNLEIADCGFFAREALPEAVTPATRRRLAEIRREVAVSQDW